MRLPAANRRKAPRAPSAEIAPPASPRALTAEQARKLKLRFGEIARECASDDWSCLYRLMADACYEIEKRWGSVKR